MTCSLARISVWYFRTYLRSLPISSDTVSAGASCNTAIRTPIVGKLLTETLKGHYLTDEDKFDRRNDTCVIEQRSSENRIPRYCAVHRQY